MRKDTALRQGTGSFIDSFNYRHLPAPTFAAWLLKTDARMLKVHAEPQVHVTGIRMEKPAALSASMTSPRMMTEVVPSPTSSSCVRLSSMMDCAR